MSEEKIEKQLHRTNTLIGIFGIIFIIMVLTLIGGLLSLFLPVWLCVLTTGCCAVFCIVLLLSMYEERLQKLKTELINKKDAM